jgi:hypothetical protein
VLNPLRVAVEAPADGPVLQAEFVGNLCPVVAIEDLALLIDLDRDQDATLQYVRLQRGVLLWP